MKKAKKLSFVGMVRKTDESHKRGSNYGYLKIPSNVDVFTPEANTNVVMDFIPYLVSVKNHPDRNENNDPPIAVEGSYWWERPFKIHRNIGADKKTYVCPTSIGKKCPICDYREKLLKEGKEYSDDEVKSLSASDRRLFNIIVRSIGKTVNGKRKKEEGDLEKIMILDQSDYLFRQKFQEHLEDKDEYETHMHPEEGCSVNIRYVESVLGTNKYPAPSRFDFEERETQYSFDIMDSATDLDKCLMVLGYEELKAEFYETERPEDNEDEEEVEEDGEEEVEEEEEEPTPKRRKPVKRGKAPVVEDDEEEEDEEEEEEPAPKKVKKGKCPFGHRFGVDVDKFDDCEDCDSWHACIAEKKSKKK